MRGEGIWDVWSASILTNWDAKQRKTALKLEWLALRCEEDRDRWVGSLQDLSGAVLHADKAVPARPVYAIHDTACRYLKIHRASACSELLPVRGTPRTIVHV
jgi:hypothetical protein